MSSGRKTRTSLQTLADTAEINQLVQELILDLITELSMISNPPKYEADRLCCCTCGFNCFSLIMAIPSESGTVSGNMAKSLLQGMVGLERLQQRHSPLVFQVSYTDPINPGLIVGPYVIGLSQRFIASKPPCLHSHLPTYYMYTGE